MDDWTGKDVVAHLACWHDHSALVIEGLRADREPYDGSDPANTTDAFNERAHREHLDDRPDVTRVAFKQSFERLLAAIKPLSEDDAAQPPRSTPDHTKTGALRPGAVPAAPQG